MDVLEVPQAPLGGGKDGDRVVGECQCRSGRPGGDSFTNVRSAWMVMSLGAVAWMAACGDDDGTQGPATSASSSVSSTSSTGGSGGSVGVGGQGGENAGGAGGEGGNCELNSLPVIQTAPALLSQTGLYDDILTKTVSSVARAYTPQYPLWSDDAQKERWLYLPECEPQIDNSDEDEWVFPVGTRAWKQFSLGGVLLETRLIHRYGPGPADFLFATYHWRLDGTDADLQPVEELNVNGTTHDIPGPTTCTRCHGEQAAKGGLPSRYLGASAIQLSHGGPGLTMASLSNDGSLSVPHAAGYTLPGDATAQAALGYFHSNCGNCHNDSSDGLFFPFIDMRMKTTDTTVAGSGPYGSLVNQAPSFFTGKGCAYLIHGGDPGDSCVHQRINTRDPAVDTLSMDQMPPIGTYVVDSVGLSAVEAWINTLPSP